MYKVVFLFFLLLSTLNSQEINIGVLYKNVFASQKEAKVGAKLWQKQMQRKFPDISLNTLFYKNGKKLIEDYEKGMITNIVLDPTFYFMNKKILDKYTSLKWILNYSEDKFINYYLIKNTESNFDIKNFDIKNIFYNNELEKVWFEKLVYENYKTNPKRILKKLKRTVKRKKLMYNVFFDKDNISIINKDLYDSMVALNPQIKHQIQIVKESKKIFFIGMGIVRKSLTSEQERITKMMNKELNNNPKSFEFLSFMDVNKVYFFEDNKELEEVEQFYEEYFKLKDKNKN